MANAKANSVFFSFSIFLSLYFSFTGGTFCQSPNSLWSGGTPTDFQKYYYKYQKQFTDYYTSYYADQYPSMKNDDLFNNSKNKC